MAATQTTRIADYMYFETSSSCPGRDTPLLQELDYAAVSRSERVQPMTLLVLS
jgi:hypothetical protein